MASRTTTKLYIAHPDENNISIVGVLEQHLSNQTTKGRKIALILHGSFGHKDYLFQKRLAHRLPIDSFRFDFRGNHETGGDFKQGRINEDIVDLQVVVEYLKSNFGYKIDMLIGHSRGSIVALYWICKSEDGRRVSAVVNVSGRYRMPLIYERFQRMKNWQSDIDTKGYYEWHVAVARKPTIGRIYLKDLQDFMSWDTSIVWNEFPAHVDVLSIHGIQDQTVPVYDALIYARALADRSPGTHNLHLVEGADHNFTERQDETVDTILEWWQMQQRGQLKSGIWKTGIRVKL